MPRYDRLGNIAFGVDRYVGVQRRGEAARVIAEPANQPGWLFDNVLLWQQDAFNDPPLPEPYFKAEDGRTWPGRANELCAGGNRWVSLLIPAEGPRLTTSEGRVIPHAGKHAVGVDGTLIYSPYRQLANGVRIELSNGSVILDDPNSPIVSSTCIDRHAAAWWNNTTTLGVYEDGNVRYCQLAYPAYGGKLFRLDGDLHVVYSGPQNLVIHAVDDATRGWLVGPVEHTYNPDAIELPNGQFFVCFSLTAGERVEDIREAQITMEPQPFPKPEEPPPATVPEFVVAHRPLPVGAWFEGNQYNLAEAGAGAERHPVDRMTRGVFVDISAENPPTANARSLARSIGWPCYEYVDGRPHDREVAADSYAMVCAYANSHESAEQNLHSIAEDVSRNQSRPWAMALSLHRGITGEGYDRPEQLVLDVAAGAWKLAVDHGAKAVWIFAFDRGNGRDGCTRFPTFMTALHKMRYASDNWEAFPPYSIPVPPKPPTGLYPTVPLYKGHGMTEVDGFLIGAAAKTGRVDPNDRDQNGRPKVHWDRQLRPGDRAGGQELVRAKKQSNGKWILVYVEANVAMNGAPDWQCADASSRQFETRPLDQVGGDEQWMLVVMPDGRIQGQTIFDWENGIKFSGVPVTFVENPK